MKRCLEKYLLYSQGNGVVHHIYDVPANIIMELNETREIRTWRGNREIDFDRVNEISASQSETGCVDGVIFMAFLDSRLVVYDGNRSRQAPFPQGG